MTRHEEFLIAEAAQSAFECRARALLAESFNEEAAARIYKQAEQAWHRYFLALQNGGH